ncbi:hypothetical protein LQ327_04330 [Actinomycetospora endophytica]|uniref:Uncharacterized protein n=1 Tax=Actinomycetospora endophytica TaxID=2291215 RepID=A0ABS8P2Z2_9PSEU|nr:hypothetical protein [Actinomycetospora endophytica]MCD2192615.1 hypothetical protein [Actinomycetospora endophytica]
MSRRIDALTRLLGPGLSIDGRRIDEDDVDLALIQVGNALRGLGQIASDEGTWSPGPDLGWLLPRATLLAELWSRD